MGYKTTVPTVYIVEWPDRGVVKLGVSGSQRWKPFLARGGRTLALWEFDTHAEAYDHEQELTAVIYGKFRQAFQEKKQALPILGTGGSGYLECFTATGADFMEAIHGR